MEHSRSVTGTVSTENSLKYKEQLVRARCSQSIDINVNIHLYLCHRARVLPIIKQKQNTILKDIAGSMNWNQRCSVTSHTSHLFRSRARKQIIYGCSFEFVSQNIQVRSTEHLL